MSKQVASSLKVLPKIKLPVLLKGSWIFFFFFLLLKQNCESTNEHFSEMEEDET